MLLLSFFFYMLRPPPSSTLFPYTTLFRSSLDPRQLHQIQQQVTKPTRTTELSAVPPLRGGDRGSPPQPAVRDRKSTRLNSSHGYISYAVFCLKKKNTKKLHYPLSYKHHHT